MIGGGPIGLHILGRLIAEGIVPPEETAIVDPHEDLFGMWHRRAANCTMPYLRSPASHGVDPDFRSLRRRDAQAVAEALHEGAHLPDDPPPAFIPPYHRPSVPLFARHLNRWAQEHLDGTTHYRGEATRIEPIEPSDPAGGWNLTVAPPSAHTKPAETGRPGGTLGFSSHIVVLAPGQPPPMIPALFHHARENGAAIRHIHEERFSDLVVRRGDRVALVGGGIAAAHVATDLVERGVSVDWWNRDRVTSHQFDSDPCFIGPRCGELFRAIDEPRRRRRLILASRRPGSVPPDLYRHVRRLESHHILRTVRTGVSAVSRADNRIVLHSDGRFAGHGTASSRRLACEYDAVILSTGFRAEPPAAALVDALGNELDLPRATDGFPVPDADLTWAPGLFVAGGLAELALGPPARNLVGAHLAGRRIVPRRGSDVA